MNSFLLSIVIPVYNEEKNIKPLLSAIAPIIQKYSYEIIFVDDGSTDRTVEMIKESAHNNARIKFVSFNRNFGHQMSLTCGYRYSKGDCVITMDADLQDPPEIIPEMIKLWQKNYKIVYAKRENRTVDSTFKRKTAQLFYRLINFLSDTPIPDDVGDYRLIDKAVVAYLNQLPEYYRFLRGLVAWGGFPTTFVYFKRHKRFSGSTHYTFSKMFNFALEGITSFSTKPLRIASYLGFFSAFIGFLGILYALIGKLFQPSFFPHDWVTGWTGLFVGIMFLGGVQLLTIGIIGEYISKIYIEVQKRPQYLIKEKFNTE